MTAATDLGASLATWHPARGTVGIVPLGQAGIALRSGDDLVLIDPFLSRRPDRLAEPPVDPGALRDVTAVLATHEHLDHLDLPVWPPIARASPAATFVVPDPIVELVLAAGIPSSRVVGIRPGRAVQLGSARVTAVPARHGVHVADGYSLGPADAPRWVGYVVDLDGVRLYHAGDSLSDPVIVDAVRALRPHVAFLPMNGRDAEREARDIVGNMTADEAAALARELEVELAVPIHFNGIRGNEGPPEGFRTAMRREHPTASVWVPDVGARFVWPGAGDPRDGIIG